MHLCWVELDKVRGHLVLAATGIIVLSMLTACGGPTAPAGGAAGANVASPPVNGSLDAKPDAGYYELPARQIALSDALEDVAAYEPPPGGDAELYGLLAAELGRVLTDLYGDDEAARAKRRLSYLPPADWDRAWCFQCASLPNGTTILHWRGRHLGDYNMDGLVTANDLTPLGFNYNVTVNKDEDGLPVAGGDNEWAAVVDGSDDGLVGISDITQIGQNYNSRMIGYRVYLGTTPDGVEFTWDTEYQPNADDPALGYTVAFKSSRSPGAVQIYTYELQRPEPIAGTKLYARIASWDGETEGTPTDIPVVEGPHAMFKCDVCHTMLNLEFRGITGSCQGCHGAPPEDKQSSWADSPVMHRECMSCHAEHGFAIAPPQAVCGSCHGSIVTQTGAAGMPECLGCHSAAHLPLDQPTAIQCIGCHTEPPDKPGISWDLAPGLHGDCNQCHDRHTFGIETMEGVCVNCHSALITGGHAGGSAECMMCHESPHIPSKSVAGMDCTKCHPVPPENPTALWSDAPGNHGQCFMCHIGEVHGVKPVPPESICGDCHADKTDGSHGAGRPECLDCHHFPHLPDSVLTRDDCLNCHPAPPEDLTASWDDAPGLHADCFECHPGPAHGNKPVPPEAICSDCHAVLIAGSHAAITAPCLDCHNFAHLPDYAMSSVACQTCHPAPPEDLAASWEDAPGQHAECGMCHVPTQHGAKPVPPESNCGDCHGELIAADHAGGTANCLGCHSYVHLPEVVGLHDNHWGGSISCYACHSHHGGGGYPLREDCLACHPEREEHYPGQLCYFCHYI